MLVCKQSRNLPQIDVTFKPLFYSTYNYQQKARNGFPFLAFRIYFRRNAASISMNSLLVGGLESARPATCSRKLRSGCSQQLRISVLRSRSTEDGEIRNFRAVSRYSRLVMRRMRSGCSLTCCTI